MIPSLLLPFRSPFDWDLLVGFLAPRSIPGVERVDREVYRRSLNLDGVPTILSLDRVDDRHLRLSVSGHSNPDLRSLARRIAEAFDLDGDSVGVGARLARDPLLAPLVARWPGFRVPGAIEPFELAVRAILGQQVSVAAATTLAGRIVTRYGTPLGVVGTGLTHLFPAPDALTDVDGALVPLPRARAATISSLARALVATPDLLSRDRPLDEIVARLDALPGIGPWTAHYIAMRGLGARDAFPASDLGLRKAAMVDGVMPSAGALDARAEAWRPYRASAAMLLWFGLGAGG